MAASAEDQARLLVSIEATQKRFEKQMAAIAKNAGDNAGNIEKRFRQANDNIGRSFDAGAKKAAVSMGQARAATANLSFQLNDIAMGLASGTSPFTIMVQQGSQVAQALQGAGGGLVGSVKALGGAFAAMVNPVSLASYALIGAVGYAIQYFTAADEGSEDVNKALKEQVALLDRVASAWGDQLPAVAELSKRLKEIADANDRAAATAMVVADAYKPAQAELAEIEGLVKQVYSRLRAERFPDDAVKKFSGAWNDLQKALETNTAKASDAQRMIDALTQFPGAPKVDDLTNRIKRLAEMLGTAAEKATDANSALMQYDYENNPLGRRFRQERGILELPQSAPTPDRRVDPYFDDPVSSGARAGKAAAEEFDKLAGGTIGRYVDQVVGAESGGDRFAKNPNSSATGLGQFIESTWIRLFRENFPDRAKSMSDSAILAYRTNADVSRQMIEAYARQNFDLLQKAGVAVNEAGLHLAHFLGPGGAISVLKADPGTPVSSLLSSDAIKANPTILGGGATAGDVVRYAERRAQANSKVAASNREISGSYLEMAGAAGNADIANRKLSESYNQLGDIGLNAVKSLANALSDGKLEASELLDIVINIVTQLASMPGGLGGIGSLLGGGGGGLLGGMIIPGILHKGGVAGEDGYGHGRAVSSSVFAGARRYHKGTLAAGLRAGEVPAILQRGEVVIPRGGKVGGAETIRVVLQDDSGRMAEIADQQIRTRSGTIIQVAVQQSTKSVRKQMPGMMAEAQNRSF